MKRINSSAKRASYYYKLVTEFVEAKFAQIDSIIRSYENFPVKAKHEIEEFYGRVINDRLFSNYIRYYKKVKSDSSLKYFFSLFNEC